MGENDTVIIPAMNIHFERIYMSFGVKCYAMRSLPINKKTVTQRFTQFIGHKM